MIENLTAILKEKYTLIEKDAGEFGEMKVSGMKFRISSCSVPGLGNVSTLTAKGFFGLMKMETLIIVPVSLDKPLLSWDYVNAGGNETVICELYDTLLSPFDASAIGSVKKKYASIPDGDGGKHWYDEIKLGESIYKKCRKNASLPSLSCDYLRAYLDSPSSDVTDRLTKKEKTERYVTGLISHGGPSTDVFKKKIGEEKTAQLFRNVLFRTDN